MIKGRRTSPDTGVGFFGAEVVVSSSGDCIFPGEETGVVALRLRGGGIILCLDGDVFLSGSGERSTCGEFVSGITKGGTSGMVSDGGACVCVDCNVVAFVVALASGSAGVMLGLAVPGPLSRFSL